MDEEKIEYFELYNPHIILTDQWRARKEIWGMVFALQDFIKGKKDNTKVNFLDTILHNRIYQISQLCKINNEQMYSVFYPFIVLITHLIQFVQFVRTNHDDNDDKKKILVS